MGSAPLPLLEGRIAAVFTREPKRNDLARTFDGCNSTEGCERPVFTRRRVPADQAVEVIATGLSGDLSANNSGRWVHVRGFLTEEGLDRSLLIQTSAHIDTIRGAGLDLREPLPEGFGAGDFGENFYLDAPDFHSGTVCVGDEFACWRGGIVQALRIRVASPRCPCGNVDTRLGKTATLKGVRAFCVQTGCGGFFIRVLSPGDVREGDVLRLAKRPNPSWDCARVTRLLYSHPTATMNYLGRSLKACKDRCTPSVRRDEWMGTEEELRELAVVPELANVEWKENLEQMLGMPGSGRYRPLKKGFGGGKSFVVLSALLVAAAAVVLSLKKL